MNLYGFRSSWLMSDTAQRPIGAEAHVELSACAGETPPYARGQTCSPYMGAAKSGSLGASARGTVSQQEAEDLLYKELGRGERGIVRLPR